MPRKIVRGIINGEKEKLISFGLEDVNIEACWTIFDEDMLWDSNLFNPYNGKPIVKGEDLEGLVLQHGQGILLDDIIDDWRVAGKYLVYYTTNAKMDDEIDILVEYTKE
ncbi:MAG: hypothetical protein ACOCQR_03120 [bacterium]